MELRKKLKELKGLEKLKKRNKVSKLNKDDLIKTIDIWKNKAKATGAAWINKLPKEKLGKIDRKRALQITGAAVSIVAVCTIAIIATRPTGYVLAQGEKTLGYIASPKALDAAVAVVEQQLAKTTGIDEIIFEDDEITCTATKEKDIEVLDEKGLEQLLMNSDLMKANAWAVRIDDKKVLAASTQEAAQQILDGVTAAYQTDDSQLVEVAYRQAVGFAQEAVQVGDLVSVEDGINLILTGAREPKTYVVQDGDTIWDIAVANGLSPYELQEMNPGFNPEKIKIGQEINLVAIHPYLTVVTTELVATNEEIAYDTVYENSDSLYKGQTKIKTQGVCGVQKTTSQVVKENGVIVATTAVGTEVVSQPQAQVAYKGTRSLSSFTGSGTLSRPVPLNVSSAFGSRGSGRHTGVDLRNPKGTPIHAADDGVVTFSGYSGTYGNIVKLSHGNGLETWYAHCDTLGVAVGDVVSKGQQIATVGITGRATGYHVHFEVRKNGVPQNPMNYL